MGPQLDIAKDEWNSYSRRFADLVSLSELKVSLNGCQVVYTAKTLSKAVPLEKSSI